MGEAFLSWIVTADETLSNYTYFLYSPGKLRFPRIFTSCL